MALFELPVSMTIHLVRGVAALVIPQNGINWCIYHVVSGVVCMRVTIREIGEAIVTQRADPQAYSFKAVAISLIVVLVRGSQRIAGFVADNNARRVPYSDTRSAYEKTGSVYVMVSSS